MAIYANAIYAERQLVASADGGAAFDTVIDYLRDVWLDDYDRVAPDHPVIETDVGGFTYLFDTAGGRLIAAWGMSKGRHGGPRDAARMAGHPHPKHSHYHRGHAIPHTLGGPTDINLVRQNGAVNVGPFRYLERRAVATPGALYFTYWVYGSADGQVPVAVDQGLLILDQPPQIRAHLN